MSRWGPDADGRLYQSALQLIFERGYDQVTVAEIAEHAGLKKRSFFRYFADKREVLFAGSADFQHTIVEAVRRAPITSKPIDAVMLALAEAGAGLTNWGEPVRQRQRIIASSTELRERELIKLDALTTAVADALRHRGVEDLTATLVAPEYGRVAPGESHPRAPTERSVTVARHSALLTGSVRKRWSTPNA